MTQRSALPALKAPLLFPFANAKTAKQIVRTVFYSLERNELFETAMLRFVSNYLESERLGPSTGAGSEIKLWHPRYNKFGSKNINTVRKLTKFCPKLSGN